MRISTSDPAVTSPLGSSEGTLHPDGTGEAAGAGRSPFATLLRGLGRELDQGERAMRAAVGASTSDHGAGLAPAQLIALQVKVYRYSEAFDVASRLVDRAASGVKTVLQGSGS